MPHSLHFPILQELGLSETESLIYELLLESGTTPAKDLVEVSGMGRGNVYNVLMQLQAKGLVLIIEGKKQQFQAVDPSNLRTLLKTKLYEAERLNASFEQTLPLLASAFNLSTGKPAIQIFEGIEGYKSAVEDMLRSQTTILTYVDVAALTGPLGELDRWYETKRVQRGIQNHILVADTPKNHLEFKQPSELSSVRYMKNFPDGFKTALEIYDGKVCYFTLNHDHLISVIIKDASIYQMHQQQFEYLWNQAATDTDAAVGTGSKTT